jgi:hypothetical protein
MSRYGTGISAGGGADMVASSGRPKSRTVLWIAIIAIALIGIIIALAVMTGGGDGGGGGGGY